MEYVAVESTLEDGLSRGPDESEGPDKLEKPEVPDVVEVPEVAEVPCQFPPGILVSAIRIPDNFPTTKFSASASPLPPPRGRNPAPSQPTKDKGIDEQR